MNQWWLTMQTWPLYWNHSLSFTQCLQQRQDTTTTK